MRLYEVNDAPERRAWLDRLLRFMEDNKTPIQNCPTISKQPLDLYALYMCVRERGGFEEVSVIPVLSYLLEDFHNVTLLLFRTS